MATPTAPSNSGGHIIAIVGGKGGVGKSVFAANFAVAMALDSKMGPALVDFDPNGSGDINLILGAKQAKNMGDPLLEGKVKDSAALKQLMGPVQVQPGAPLFTLQMASSPERLLTEDEEKIEAALKLIRRTFPVTIVDCGNQIDGAVLKVIDLATLVLVITNPEILVLSQSRKLVDRLQIAMVPQEITKVIVNRFPAGNPYTPQFIEQSLKRQVLGVIPEDTAAASAALSKGTPFVLMSPQSAATKNIYALSRLLIEKRVLEQLSQVSRSQRPVKAAVAPGSADSGSSSGGGANENKPGRVGRDPSDARSLFKVRMHGLLVEKMDLKAQQLERDMSSAKKLEMRNKATKILMDLLATEDHNWKARDQVGALVVEILDETFGLGPLESLLADDSVTEIMVNRADRIYIEKSGKNMKSPVTFSSNRQLKTIIERIVSPMGRVINESSPYVDARLADGSRVHAIIPPLAIDGPMITIRKFPKKRLGPDDMVKFGSLTAEMADFLRACIEARLNVIVSGGTGSGKTTLLNVLSTFIPATERILTVEDAAELQLQQEHVGRLETRPAGIEGNNAVTIRDLVKQTLRMKPDRIIIGEVRGGEALDMLQAMNTGHDGSMATVHANNPRDALVRLETLVMMAGMDMPAKAIREQIAGAVHLIVQQTRLSDGSRKITYITEVCGMQGDVITTQNIYEFKSTGVDANRKVIGKHAPTGFMPKAMEKIESLGIKLPKNLFKAA